MSRKADLLTSQDVPKYIKEIVSRLYELKGKELAEYYENHSYSTDDTPGYVFKLYGRRKIGAEIGSSQDVEKLIKWARSWYAEAELKEEHLWYNDVKHGEYDYRGTKTHKAKAYRENFRNYWILVISDPVCLRFERDNFYR